jgi:hypothetical protein
MKALLLAGSTLLLLAACPIDHAGGGLPPGDAGGSSADSGGGDASAVDRGATDSARADAAGTDSARPDSARPDTSAADAGAACLGDDSYEENDSATQAAVVTAPGSLADLIGCDDDWYAFTLPAGRTLTVTIRFSDALADLDLYLYTAAAPGTSIDSSLSTSDDESVAGPGYTVDTPMLVRVHRFSGGSAPYSMEINYAEPQAHDTCAAAEQLSVPLGGQATTASGDTSLATDTRNATLDSCQGRYAGDISPELFYTFTTSASMDGYVLAELDTAAWRGVIYVLEGGCQASAELACGEEDVAFPVLPSTAYHVVVDAYDYDAGAFDLTLRYVPPATNDTCETAQPVSVPTSGAVVELSGTTVASSHTRSAEESSEWCQAVARYAPELFYRVDTGAGGEGTLQVSLDTPGWEAAVYLFEESCAASVEALCVGEYYRDDPLWFRHGVAANSTYYLVVDGYGDTCCDAAAGAFTLSLGYYHPEHLLEGGETCDVAVALSANVGGVHGSTASGADDLAPEDVGCSGWAGGYDKFYRLNLAAGQTATVRMTHGDAGNGAHLYALRPDCPVRADSCVAATSFDEQQGGEITFQNTSGASADYLIVVDADSYYEGEEYDLYWEISGP